MNRNEVAYFADVIKQVLAQQRCCGGPWALVLPELTVLEPPLHTVKSSDGLTDRNDREDQRRRLALCWLLSSPLMTIITSPMYTMGITQLERTKRPTAIF